MICNSLISDDSIILGAWRKERLLGNGGFGSITLWRNLDTGDSLALKLCRLGDCDSLSPKQCDRWRQEVEILKKLDHPNVIKALNVPPELEAECRGLPFLAMEYCSGGDLRKVLNKTDNCCGLKERQVRWLLKDTSSALDYLHKLRIIHRDLKPENIVLQQQNERVIYKLIDLGYAKELDQSSLCSSFVGTLQYLAPELFHRRLYTSVVDYWSFGLLTHEVITGERPFFPSMSPPQWIPIVCKKATCDIRAFHDIDGNVVFSETISPFNYITNILKSDLEQWLQIMLEWDPNMRGRRDGKTGFQILNEILEKKVIHVFDVENLVVHSLALPEEFCLSTIQLHLEELSGIQVQDQLLLHFKGATPDSEKISSSCLKYLEDGEVMLYLFKLTSLDNPVHWIPMVPIAVGKMHSAPQTPMKFGVQKQVWGQTIHFCQQEVLKFQYLVHAYKSCLMYLVTRNGSLHKSTVELVNRCKMLTTKAKFFQESYSRDMSHFEEFGRNHPFYGDIQLPKHWKRGENVLERVRDLEKQVSGMESGSHVFNSKTVEFQRTPYAKSKNSNILDEVYQKVIATYDSLKRRPKEQRRNMEDSKEMAKHLKEFFLEQKRVFDDILLYIRKVCSVIQEVEKVGPAVETLSTKINDLSTRLSSLQEGRQKDVWRLLSFVHDSETGRRGNEENVWQPGKNNVIHSFPSLGSSHSNSGIELEAGESLSMRAEKQTLESLHIKQESQHVRKELQEVRLQMEEQLQSLLREKDNFDYSFLYI